MAISTEESELFSGHSTDTSTSGGGKDFSIQTKHKKRCSPAIRKLHYTLLASQVPTSSISDIIEAVIKCFTLS